MRTVCAQQPASQTTRGCAVADLGLARARVWQPRLQSKQKRQHELGWNLDRGMLGRTPLAQPLQPPRRCAGPPPLPLQPREQPRPPRYALPGRRATRYTDDRGPRRVSVGRTPSRLQDPLATWPFLRPSSHRQQWQPLLLGLVPSPYRRLLASCPGRNARICSVGICEHASLRQPQGVLLMQLASAAESPAPILCAALCQWRN